jgi:hypothetical protein
MEDFEKANWIVALKEDEHLPLLHKSDTRPGLKGGILAG